MVGVERVLSTSDNILANRADKAKENVRSIHVLAYFACSCSKTVIRLCARDYYTKYNEV